MRWLSKQFRKIDLLIIDELGYVTFDLTAAELLFQLLATRYETMSTIITSNLSFSDWVKVFHDRTLTAAMLDGGSKSDWRDGSNIELADTLFLPWRASRPDSKH
jgi:hypothetical protein